MDAVSYVFIAGGAILVAIVIRDIVVTLTNPRHRRVGWYERFGWRRPPPEEDED